MSTMARVSTVPPLLPTTPKHAASVSAMLPWPEMVVATMAPQRAANCASSASAPDNTTPPPTMTSLLGIDVISAVARSISCGSAPLRRAG